MHQPSEPSLLGNAQLVRELLSDAGLLFERQLRLARLEAGLQLKNERTALELLSAGGILGYAAVVVLLVAAGLAFGTRLGQAWAGVLIVGGALLAISIAIGLLGYGRREREALPISRRELKQEMAWARRELRPT